MSHAVHGQQIEEQSADVRRLGNVKLAGEHGLPLAYYVTSYLALQCDMYLACRLRISH